MTWPDEHDRPCRGPKIDPSIAVGWVKNDDVRRRSADVRHFACSAPAPSAGLTSEAPPRAHYEQATQMLAFTLYFRPPWFRPKDATTAEPGAALPFRRSPLRRHGYRLRCV